MTSKSDALSASLPHRKEIITGFDPVILRAPFFLRCGALVFDYLLVIVFPVLGLLLGRFLGNDGARLLTSEVNNLAWLVAILVGISNILLLPLIAGQSLGKMLAGIRIVTINGEEASLSSILLRQTLGYALTLASGGLGFFFSVFSSKGRALHDCVAGTVVVYGTPTPRR